MKPLEFNDTNFEIFLHENAGLVLVNFGASWCPSCLMMDPVLENKATELSGKAAIYKLDVDANPITTTMFDVKYIPTTILFKNGKAIKQIAGAIPKNALMERFRLLAA